MKRLALCFAALALAVSVSAQTPAMPPFLRAGDKVALLSMSSAPGDPTSIDSAAQVLRSWGFVTEVGEHAKSQWHSFAGTPEERLSDIMKALRDPEVKAIFSTRGGYGAANVLALLPLDTLRRYGNKWIVGYSDITAYLSAQVCAGYMGIHGGMGGHLASTGGKDYASQSLLQLLTGTLPSYTGIPAHALNHQGTATGVVIGGNMSVYGDIAGSPYDFFNDSFLEGRDVILFIEDVGESYMHIDRMLQHLRLRGVLGKVRGIIVGRFADCEPSRGFESVEQLIDQYLGDVSVPVCYDFPASHDESWNYPLVEGCPATLTVAPTGVSLQFHNP